MEMEHLATDDLQQNPMLTTEGMLVSPKNR